MGILDSLKGNQYKAELEALQQEHELLKASLSPEMQNAITLKNKVDSLQNQISEKQAILDSLYHTIASLEITISEKEKQIVCLDDEILVQEFGLYTPQFDFANSLGYKDALAEVRAEQKAMIKNKNAVTGNTDWSVNGSASKGKKMVTDTQKLLLRAFNSECDELVGKVKYTNFAASLDKIRKSSAAISKLGAVMNISVTPAYLSLKEKELRLSFEYQCKKQQEKEEAKEARAQMREAAKLQRELEEQRKKIEKEQAHYQRALLSILKQLETASEEEKTELLSKRKEFEKELSDIETSLTDIDYREANQRAGYVYIISNIGSFGENVYKIGMTRRLEPQDRIDELGSASVPFNFDVHAMIFSDDAPALEAALHRAFENKKLNMVNHRREFFYATLDEIKEVIQDNFDKTVEFIDVPNAEQYRVSQKMRLELGMDSTSFVRANLPNPSQSPLQTTAAQENQKKHPSQNYLHTKWGTYEMPDPYKLKLSYGPRTDTKSI